jgi:predicted polyphosphate/ATP-dependent NAD kinase
MAAPPPTIGLIANPVSARDIRRVVANANNLQTADRVNIVLRVLAAAGSCGVGRVLTMPDTGGISAMLSRCLGRERAASHQFPDVEFLDMPVQSTVEDTFAAARRMRAAGVAAIVVLGGDGTHRAVARECGDVPIAGISTGTNNAFPEMREPTITGMAVGLYASGRLRADQVLVPNKVLEVQVDRDAGPSLAPSASSGASRRRDIALVDAVISTDRYTGARALWRTESLRWLYVTFADPEAIGMSAIAGLLEPVGRREPGGCAVELCPAPETPKLTLLAPIAPGMVRPVGISGWHRMEADQTFRVEQQAGVVALDGERELTFDPGDLVTITLREGAFRSLDVSRCLQIAAADGLLRL